MKRNYTKLTRRALLSAVLAAGVATPLLADKKKDKDKDDKDTKSQSDQAKAVLDQQKDIAKELRDKKADSPDELQKQVDAAKADVDAEDTRHASALDSLNKELKTFTDANDKKHIEKTQKAIDKENDAYTAKSAKLKKRVDDLQAKLDDGKKPTPPAPPTPPPPDPAK